jgi:hypothetical protein
MLNGSATDEATQERVKTIRRKRDPKGENQTSHTQLRGV